jgi:hypothetical protein
LKNNDSLTMSPVVDIGPYDASIWKQRTLS